MLRAKVLFQAAMILLLFASSGFGQMKPQELAPDNYVKLVLNDSSQFYAIVLAKPLPDRIIAETRYGRLEIPLNAISYAIDYRYNWVQKDDLTRASTANNVDNQQFELSRLLLHPKINAVSVVSTRSHDLFFGHRYLFDDSAHVILSTDYGNLFFKYPDLEYVDNWSGHNDRKEEFLTTTYLVVKDPLSSQNFLMPTATSFGGGHTFVMDYLIAGLQINEGITDWLSVNGGGVFAPFLPTPVTTATAGIKFSPYQTDQLSIAFGAQGVYSKVAKITRIGFPYVVASYGSWESSLSILGGISYQNTEAYDSLHNEVGYYPVNSVIGVAGNMRIGENLKGAIELYFIGDFGIVPTVASIRYFENNLTIDVAVVFSLYKAGDRTKLQTLGQYVFNTNFDVIPMVSGSYHF